MEKFLGLCRIQNLVVDLNQEAPHDFDAQLKADSDYRVSRTIKKRAMWANPLLWSHKS